jgi:hypothetical protein
MNKNQPVTFRELIDAISRLHVINDSPSNSGKKEGQAELSYSEVVESASSVIKPAIPSRKRLEASFSSILNKPSRSKRKCRIKSGQKPDAVNFQDP